jgi:isochorismate synthase/2-succinyl-5-enolpyruvyl-6-hydroxy-3-cyclohexene-1-carboxylate synthase/2-succinyl-6-hydroxy-2,4-cyclohexadiene-1-carboxylate synthase/O-succinylbenzoate synthase
LVADVLKFCISLEAVKLTNFCRFLSDESAMVTAYGFPDIEFNKYSTVNSKDGSSYFFVPQIELDEHEEVSILAVTLAWNESLSYTVEQTISSYEKSIFQVC